MFARLGCISNLPGDEVMFHVAIHHHTQYSVTRNTGIQISPGFKYKIGVRPTEVSCFVQCYDFQVMLNG